MERVIGTKRNAQKLLRALFQQLAESMDESSDTADKEELNHNTKDQELFSTLVAEVENEKGRGGVLEEDSIHLINMDTDV